MTLGSDQADRIGAVLRPADPAAVWAVGGPDGILAGSADHRGNGAPVDAGALAGVLALWPVIGSLVAEGSLHLHTPLTAYGSEAAVGAEPAGRGGAVCGSGAAYGAATAPGAGAAGRVGFAGGAGAVTAHHLLTRTGGPADHTAALTRLAEHLGGTGLAELAATRIWHPLGMTATRFTGTALHATVADLARFLSHLLAPADHPVSRAWTSDSLRIRTGELTPARGLLWNPAPGDVWYHGDGAAVWVAPRLRRWALLLPSRPPGRLRTAFREAVFARTGAGRRQPDPVGPFPQDAGPEADVR